VPAGQLWNRLQKLDGVGPVVGGKLLARKRPHLAPIADSVVIAALQPARGQFWATLRECLRDEQIRNDIERLRPAGHPALTVLRLLDVAVWMRHSRSAPKVRARLGMSDRNAVQHSSTDVGP